MAVGNFQQSDFDADFQGDYCDTDDGRITLFSPIVGDIEWDAESGFDDWRIYRGDLTVLKATDVYTQVPGSNPLAAQFCGAYRILQKLGEGGIGEVWLAERFLFLTSAGVCRLLSPKTL